MTVAKKVVIFAHSFVGLEIIKYFIEHYSDDLLQVVVMQKESDIYTYAKNNKIKVSIYGSNEYVNFISSNEFDTGFLIWWPKIISKELLTKAKNGFINTHPSFLPFCKGKHYNFWTLVKNCKFGVTLHYVDEGIDTGDIICIKEFDFNFDPKLIDLIFDPLLRAVVLIYALKHLSKKYKNSMLQNISDGEDYFIIHPLLKHVAILKEVKKCTSV
jgi:methionyl-tRNA formyltransferase